MTLKYPFLISIPHGGTGVPREIRPILALMKADLRYYCDPQTRILFGFEDQVTAFIDTDVSRMIVDVNRPPLPLPPRDPDGIIKVRTIDGREVYRKGQFPDMVSIHRLMMTYYFPYHQRIDQLIDHKEVRIAFDCHSMLPVGSLTQKDAGKSRPLICLSNNGDRRGRAKKGRIVTCPPEMIGQLADIFRDEFLAGREVAINDPFTGGFIINAHYWHKGIPFIQIEVNRSLYESEWSQDRDNEETRRCVVQLKDRIWNVLTRFWENIG